MRTQCNAKLLGKVNIVASRLALNPQMMEASVRWDHCLIRNFQSPSIRDSPEKLLTQKLGSQQENFPNRLRLLKLLFACLH